MAARKILCCIIPCIAVTVVMALAALLVSSDAQSHPPKVGKPFTRRITPVADSWISAEDPAGDLCSAKALRVGHNKNYQALLRFDLSSIPTGATVRAAWVRLHARAFNTENDQLSVACYQVTEAWGCPSVTWCNPWDPDPMGECDAGGARYDPDPFDTEVVSADDVPQWYSWSVGGLVETWLASPSDNLGVVLLHMADTTGWFDFDATESDVNWPYLEVQFDPPAPEISVTKELLYPQDQPVRVGHTFTHRIHVTNTGRTTIAGVELVDAFDQDYVRFSTSTVSPTEVHPGVLRWTSSALSDTLPLTPGQSLSLGVDYLALRVTAHTTNTVAVEGADEFTQSAVAEDEAWLPIVGWPNVIVHPDGVQPAGGVVSVGGQLAITFGITNVGTVALTRAVVRSTYDSGYLHFDGASIPPDDADSGELSWMWDESDSFLPLRAGNELGLQVRFIALKQTESTLSSAATRSCDEYGLCAEATSDPVTLTLQATIGYLPGEFNRIHRSQLIVNGGFDQGDEGWQLHGAELSSQYGNPKPSAMLREAEARLVQSIRVPYGLASARLWLEYNAWKRESPGTPAPSFTIALQSVGDPEDRCAIPEPVDWSPGWKSRTYQDEVESWLKMHSAQEVKLVFEVANGGPGKAGVNVDNVSLSVTQRL